MCADKWYEELYVDKWCVIKSCVDKLCVDKWFVIKLCGV